jgi:hypothetical protein
LNSLLSSHGKAFVFFSLLRKMRTKRLPVINAGYIVTPDKKKKWLSYPKLANWRGEVSLFDKDVLINAMRIQHLSYKEQQAKITPAMKAWVDISRKLVRDFPSVLVNGTKFQLRVCADSCRHEGMHPSLQKGIHAPDVVIVPAKNLRDQNPDFKTWPKKIGKHATMIVVDGGGMDPSTRVLKGASAEKVFHSFGVHPVNENVQLVNGEPFRTHPKKSWFRFSRRR